MFARLYSLQNGISSTNTIERLKTLKLKEIIDENTGDELIFVYNFLMKLRFKNQVNLMENNMPLSNTINTKSLMEIEISFLKKVLSKSPIFQTKISNDFRLKSIS
jgi:CBS domain-containing protein